VARDQTNDVIVVLQQLQLMKGRKIWTENGHQKL